MPPKSPIFILFGEDYNGLFSGSVKDESPSDDLNYLGVAYLGEVLDGFSGGDAGIFKASALYYLSGLQSVVYLLDGVFVNTVLAYLENGLGGVCKASEIGSLFGGYHLFAPNFSKSIFSDLPRWLTAFFSSAPTLQRKLQARLSSSTPAVSEDNFEYRKSGAFSTAFFNGTVYIFILNQMHRDFVSTIRQHTSR